MSIPTEASRMPVLPGFYYDSATNRYYKGTRPPPPPKPPTSTCSTSLPGLLRATALGRQTTTAALHASLLHTAKSCQTNPILTDDRLITPKPQHNAIIPSETFAHMPVASSTILLLAFPQAQLDHVLCASEYEPIALTSHGYNLAYATTDGVWVYVAMDNRVLYRRIRERTRTVSLSASHFLMAGRDVRVQKLWNPIIPQRPVITRVGAALCSDMIDPDNFAVGNRAGRVVLADGTSFQPSGANRSLTALKIKGNLVWCSTMCGEPGVTAWDVRCLSSPALVCKGQSNMYKQVGLDVSDTIVIAGSDDQHVRVWDVRGSGLLSKISVPRVVKRIKMAGWTGRTNGTCGVWFDDGNQLFARIVCT